MTRRLAPGRLSSTETANLIARYQAGNAVRDLAERFNLGTTTVKRLLRQHKSRPKDQHNGVA